jgi:glycine dehydrogenase subunit 2
LEDFQQARWSELLVFELGSRGRKGYSLPRLEESVKSRIGGDGSLVPRSLVRRIEVSWPELSEVEVLRHFTSLSQMNFGVGNGFYPLGSCTMKYNPKMNDILAALDESRWVHPYQPEETMQGTLEIMYKLASWLAEITGTSKVSLQPSAGAQGELTGVLIIRAYHKHNEESGQRDEIIVPDSAHGTNPASASMAGFKVVIVPTGRDGCVNLEALKEAVSSRTAGLMLTNPNTLGIFEERIVDIASIVHEKGGLLYYDGANLNAVLGKTRPGDMGFDIVHLNLHKTFSTPHGGGGPGAGPIGVKEPLVDFLPVPLVEFDGKRCYLNYDVEHTIGKVRSFYGNFEVLLKAFAYILTLGADGLNKVSDIAVLNANYLARKLQRVNGFDLPYGREKPVKHEFVLSCSRLKSETGISARDVAKRLLDHGIHAPTTYFPPIVEEALMIEPTETEPAENLDRFVEALASICREAQRNPENILRAPFNTSVGRVDEVKASHPRTMCLSWRMHRKRVFEKSQNEKVHGR